MPIGSHESERESECGKWNDDREHYRRTIFKRLKSLCFLFHFALLLLLLLFFSRIFVRACLRVFVCVCVSASVFSFFSFDFRISTLTQNKNMKAIICQHAIYCFLLVIQSMFYLLNSPFMSAAAHWHTHSILLSHLFGLKYWSKFRTIFIITFGDVIS